MFVSLYYYFRRLLYASLSTASNAEIADAIGVKEYAVTIAKKQSKAFSPKRLLNIVDELSALDANFKTGKIEQSSAVMNGVFEILLG